jgi:hypothetical protein
MKIFGEPCSSEVYTYCKHELMQAIWALLLDEKFMHAYEHGIVIKCGDGVTRRIFPHFFTYSADYLEKCVHYFISSQRVLMLLRVILSGIKSLGQCPCLRCLTKKTEIPLMGTKRDMKCRIRHMRKDDGKHHREVEDAGRLIFQLGVPVDGSRVKNILNDESLVPTRVSFQCYFNLYKLMMFKHRTHFRRSYVLMDSTVFECSWWMSSTNLNLVYGRHTLRI